MGQRLIVRIQEGNEDKAAVYFQWAAYSTAALRAVKKVMNLIDGDSATSEVLQFDTLPYDYKKMTTKADHSNKDWRLKLIRGLETFGGGVYKEDLSAIQKMFPTENFKPVRSSSEGVVALSQDGIAELEEYAEGEIIIDYDSGEIFDDVITPLAQTYEDYVGEGGTRRKEELPRTEIDFEAIQFDELDDAIKVVSSSSEFQDCGGVIYETIE